MNDQTLPAKDGGFINISSHRLNEWKNQFPGVDILEELAKARAWLERNPGKRWKTAQGFTNWLKNAAASTTYRREQDHISDPAQSRHAAVRYRHREYNPGQPVPAHLRNVYLAYTNRLTQGRYGQEHGELTEEQLMAVAMAPLPADSSLEEHRRCWDEFRRML